MERWGEAMRTVFGVLLLALCHTNTWAAGSVFDGTWRAEYPQKFDPERKPDELELQNGLYTCKSCDPPYSLAADGEDHPVAGDPEFNTRSITIVNRRTVTKSAKGSGGVSVMSRCTVSTDGSKLTELQTISGMAAKPFVVRMRSTRVSPGPSGSHVLSGSWHRVEFDMPNNEEDTVLHVEGNVLTMSDGMGRSFTAKLDGTKAPFNGSPEFSNVSVKLLDSHTLEESDLRGDQVVKISRWSIDPDGVTMHARFDDTQGHIQEQMGHKLLSAPH
jgi:hypothetical protein